MKQMKAIDRSIIALKRQVRSAIKELNQEAADLVARGRYDASGSLIEVAKRADGFMTELELLRGKWADVRGARRSEANDSKTPLWEYYGLIADCLTELGGEARRAEIIDWINQHALDRLKRGDQAMTNRGKVVWQRNVGRARRAMIKEGFLESMPGVMWKLTKSGRNIAKGRARTPENAEARMNKASAGST